MILPRGKKTPRHTARWKSSRQVALSRLAFLSVRLHPASAGSHENKNIIVLSYSLSLPLSDQKNETAQASRNVLLHVCELLNSNQHIPPSSFVKQFMCCVLSLLSKWSACVHWQISMQHCIESTKQERKNLMPLYLPGHVMYIEEKTERRWTAVSSWIWFWFL